MKIPFHYCASWLSIIIFHNYVLEKSLWFSFARTHLHPNNNLLSLRIARCAKSFCNWFSVALMGGAEVLWALLERQESCLWALVYKQTKNRNETGSNLSLGTRLTVLSKRLGRKRCCDATPDRCHAGMPSHYLRIVKKKIQRLLPKIEGFWLDPRAWSVPNEKMNTPNVDACAVK